MIKIVIKDWKTLQKETISKIENRLPQKEDRIIYIESIEAARKLMTNERIRLLSTVRERKPNSLYELAKIMHKNFKTVSVDANMLEEIGLIKFERHKVGLKELIKPIVSANKIQMEVSI